jgi:hypothetical protein
VSIAADDRPGLETLSASEQAAVRSAAVWYFKRHARIIADEADDDSARAVARRDDFVELHAALRKLGVPIALPDELAARV